MRLKSLELHGFKSFPDKTVLNFDRGMTVVVGPNGSGKSNISDAVRWVLGEVSAKSVRGSKMEDVIFNGSGSRRQMNYAEVSLTIDNTTGESRLLSDYDEVTITRRCYRAGDSEYMINQKPCRLRDITELFMNTGLGRGGYSIIGQGKIAEIISQKSDERRNIFEEAAGISRYRYKKEEAERKLQSVEDNLVRLNDIRSELEGRVGPLEREAEKARRYLEIFEEKKRIDIALWLYDIEALHQKLAEMENSYTLTRHELEIADDELASLETRNEKLFSDSQENKMNAERTAAEITAARNRLHDLESTLLVLENDISHMQTQITQTAADREIKRTAREAQQKSLTGQQQEYESLNETLAAEESTLEEAQAALNTLYEQRTAVEGEQNASQEKNRSLNDDLTAIKIRLAELRTGEESSGSRRAEMETERERYRASLALAESAAAKSRESLEIYRQKETECRSQIAAIDADNAANHDHAARLHEDTDRIRLDISTKKQRIDTLRRMEELFEGYQQSVRSVMNAAEKGLLTGICGPVSRLLSADVKYSIAIETALGANIQNIVVEDEQAAKNAIAYLKRSNAGRATFYPLTSVRAQSLPVSKETLARNPGFIGIASELVSFDPRFDHVIGYMLGRTAVFRDLDAATETARATGYRIRIVTLDGQLINAGGSFTGGSVKRDSGMLTRSAEIERMTDDITRAELKLKAKQAEADALAAAIKQSDEQKSSLASQLEMIHTLANAENTQLKVVTAQSESDTAHIDELTAAIAGIDSRRNETQREQEALNSRQTALEQESAAVADRFRTLEEERITLAASIRKQQDRCSALSVRIAGRRKDIEAAGRALVFAEDTIQALTEQIARSEREEADYQNKIEEARRKTETGRTDAKETKKQIDTLEAQRESFSADSRRQDETIAGLRETIRQQTHRRETIFREYTRIESKRAELLSEQDKMTARLWEDYELTYSAAAALDYPPVDAASRTQAASRQTELRGRLRALGTVNLNAVDEYKQVRERFNFLSEQMDDLTSSREELSGILFKMEREMRERFLAVMEELNRNFKQVFVELFGGGNAELRLTDPDHVLECGIEINVAPPGKIIKSLSLLSGGEQSFVAIALFFAILKVNPTPFCLLDEIEAALDDVNVARFAEYARRYSDNTQFIIITHRRGTMERADTLYGVTMPERGISRVLTLDVADAEQKLGVKL